MSKYVSGQEMVDRYAHRRAEYMRRQNEKRKKQRRRRKLRRGYALKYYHSKHDKWVDIALVCRAQVLNAYGIECVHCGDRDYDSLTIDHINNDAKERSRNSRSGMPLYKWLILRNFPAGFQTLCFSCNIIKGKRGANYGVLPPSRKDLIRNLRAAVAAQQSVNPN